MKNKYLKILSAIALSAVSLNTHAALVNGSVLSIGEGSSFRLEQVPGFYLSIGFTGRDRIITGSSQNASGSHAGLLDGTEMPGIDSPWSFLGNTGMHQTTSSTNILSDDGNGHVDLDFSGWSITWNGIANIPMSTGAWGGNVDGVANITCANTCEDGDTFTLYYSATVPIGDSSSLGDVNYDVSIFGTISSVPVPAAIWLFSSGLIGLISFK